MIEPRVVVIILNWNNAPDTNECLHSFEGQEYSNFELLVVDNGSTDGSASAIRSAFPQVEILELEENSGYAGGNNQGIRHALARSPDYVFLLNNDVVVDPCSIRKLVATAEANPRAGMVGPVICYHDRPGWVSSAGGVLDWRQGCHRHMLADSEADLVEAAIGAAAREVDYFPGTAVCLRRSVLEKVGLLDTRYYLNYEDIDWCIRMQNEGNSILLSPATRVWHKVSSTLGQASAANTYYMTRNSLLFFSTHARGLTRCLALARVLLRTCRTILAWSLKKEYRGRTFRAKRAANLFGLRDFCLRRFGAMGPDVARVCYGR